MNQEQNKVYWFYSLQPVPKPSSYLVRIVDKESHTELYSEVLTEDQLVDFVKIMQNDKYAILHLESELFGEAAKVKLESNQRRIYPLTNNDKWTVVKTTNFGKLLLE